MNAVTCQHVNAGYRHLAVLDDVSLTVAEGQMVALLGPNGAGKSTLLRVLTGLHPHSAGVVQLFDRDVRQLPANERARIVAVVPQEVTTPMAFTVEEMVKLGRWSRRDSTDIEPALTATDTLELRERLYPELSGGEKQRVIIAMALAQEPKLLLLDEPTAHLDINHRLEILRLLEKLNRERGLTVLMTSHDLNLAAEFFPQLVLMNQGCIVAAGTPSEVFQEDRLKEVFHCQLLVRPGPTGAITVTPRR